MKKFKNYILLWAVLIFNFILPRISLAGAPQQNTWGLGTLGNTGLPAGSPGAFIGRIIAWVLGLIGVILIALIVYGGFLYMTSAGNEEQVDRAKSTLTYAVIGVVVIVVSYIITDYVLSAIFS